MTKGFTLIELLAIIAILAIVLLIAVPKIINVINNVKINAAIENEKILIKATSTYLAANQNLLPINIGDTIEISLNDLQTNKYISTIKDPYDSSIICNGYIRVTKLDDLKLDYSPYLKCSDANTISNSTDDKLVAHYKFDDFQEPTVNLAQNSFEYFASYHDFTKNGTTLNFTMISAVPYIVIKQDSLGAMTGRTFSYQGYFKKNGATYLPSANLINTYNQASSISNYKTDATTGYFEETMFFDHISSTWITHWNLSNVIQNDNITIDKFQVEEKKYPTPYTPNTRTGTVKDYSPNNNNAPLTLANTPRWMIGGTNNGYYLFDGSNDYISSLYIPNITNNSLTINAWIKPTNISGSYEISNQEQWDGGPWTGWRFKQIGDAISFKLGNNTSTVYECSGSGVVANAWQQVTGVWDGSYIYIYINGIEVNKCSKSFIYVGNIGTHTIGKYPGAAYYFNGSIDDMKIYNRALATKEITYNYNIEQAIIR